MVFGEWGNAFLDFSPGVSFWFIWERFTTNCYADGLLDGQNTLIICVQPDQHTWTNSGGIRKKDGFQI